MLSKKLNNIIVRTLYIDAEPQTAIYTISNYGDILTCGVIITGEEKVSFFLSL